MGFQVGYVVLIGRLRGEIGFFLGELAALVVADRHLSHLVDGGLADVCPLLSERQGAVGFLMIEIMAFDLSERLEDRSFNLC